MSNFPMDIVVGCNKSFSDEVHIFRGRFTFSTLEDDFSTEDGP
eukprot:CAMPEP_0170963596 /NCGR_PEP_ID=MMETSP0735-20130129/39703_1 /TAXON_ID=186038 /ORGANISM="Fragilariopsis kerguelensis, Strain L26-C5" /LENGTH=42 /DNA_ID= /DNA_START= /DNA_END= /DNA_ORIENTATION=